VPHVVTCTSDSLYQTAITDPETGVLLEVCLCIFYKGESIESKLKKICDAFSAHRYSLPDMDDSSSVDKMLTENAQELVDSRTVLLKNQDTRYRLCQLLAKHANAGLGSSQRGLLPFPQHVQGVSGMLRGEGWVVAGLSESVRGPSSVHSTGPCHAESCRSRAPAVALPHTLCTNKFTYGYQNSSTHTVSRYREANPALFSPPPFLSCLVSCTEYRSRSISILRWSHFCCVEREGKR
jgi:V-type H+-transporting ATPase subunit a